MDTQKVNPLDQLTALKQQMLQIQAKLAEKPKKPEKPVVELSSSEGGEQSVAPVSPAPRKPREKTEREIVVEQLAAERKELAEIAKGLFADLDAKQSAANVLRFKNDNLTKEEDELLVGLDRQIVEITSGFFEILNLLEIWVGGHLDRADEIRVSLNFVERGILEEITPSVAEEMRKARKIFFDLPQEERQGKVPEYFTAWDVEKDGVRYFRQRRYPQQEYRAKGAVFQEEAGRLLFALSAHYARVRKEEYEARQAEEKAEQERREAAQRRREEEDLLASTLDMQVNPSMSIEDVERGNKSPDPKLPLVKIPVLREHNWRMHENGNPLTGCIYLLPLKKESENQKEEFARFQFMGATGGIRHYLLVKRVEAAQIFCYRVSTQFAGIAREEGDGKKVTPIGFLRALFSALMGIKKTYKDTPTTFNPILAAIEEGKRSPAPAEEERKKHGKKKGDGREHRPVVRHRDGRGGGQNLILKYMPYGKV